MNSILPVAQPFAPPFQDQPLPSISNSSIWETAPSTAFWAFERTISSFVDTVRGAAIYSVFLGAITKGEICKFFYNLIFNRKAFELEPFSLPLEERQLFYMYEADAFASKNSKHSDNIRKDLNFFRIFDSQTPRAEFLTQLSKIPLSMTFQGRNINAFGLYYSQNIMMNFLLAFVSPIWEEFLFRGLIQDLILKQLGIYILNTTAPQYVSQEEESIWYSMGRIALTSYLFSYAHESNRAELGANFVNSQRKYTLILGFVSGCLKEYFGLSSAIGAHLLTNIYGTTVSFLKLRDTKVD